MRSGPLQTTAGTDRPIRLAPLSPARARRAPARLALAALTTLGLGVLPLLGACASDDATTAPDTTDTQNATPVAGDATSTTSTTATTAPAPTPAAPAEPVNPWTTLGYRLAWTGFTATPKGGTVQAAGLVGSMLVVGDSRGVVSALSTGGGELRWGTGVASSSMTFRHITTDGTSVLALTDGKLFVIDPRTGEELRAQRLDRSASTSAVALGDALIYGTPTGFAVAHRFTNGLPAWAQAVGGPVSVDPVAVGTSGVALASETGGVVIVDRYGTSLGRRQLYGAAAGLAANADVLFVASRDQSLYALDRIGASVRWQLRTDTPLVFGPTAHDGRVYQALPNVGLAAIDASTGQRLWTCPDVNGRVIAIRKGRLIAFDGSKAWTIDAARGEVVDSVELPKVLSLLPDAFVDGNIYAIEASGRISKFSAR